MEFLVEVGPRRERVPSWSDRCEWGLDMRWRFRYLELLDRELRAHAAGREHDGCGKTQQGGGG
jgi:hypothetical protein